MITNGMREPLRMSTVVFSAQLNERLNGHRVPSRDNHSRNAIMLSITILSVLKALSASAATGKAAGVVAGGAKMAAAAKATTVAKGISAAKGTAAMKAVAAAKPIVAGGKSLALATTAAKGTAPGALATKTVAPGATKILALTGKCEASVLGKVSCEGSLTLSGDVSEAALVATAAAGAAGATIAAVEIGQTLQGFHPRRSPTVPV